MLGVGVQTLQVQDQERPASVEVRPKLIHHHFFYIFTHGFGFVPCMFVWFGVRSSPLIVGAPIAWPWPVESRPAQAETRTPGLMVADTVIERM